MKRLRITVEGREYDVVVEVLEDDEPYLPTSQPARPASPPAPLPAGDNGGRARPSLAKGQPDVLAAPIAGTVQKVFVEQGAAVEAQAPVMLLDAMKMDTYIYAPRAAKVKEVCVSAGESVRVGQCLVRFEPAS